MADQSSAAKRSGSDEVTFLFKSVRIAFRDESSKAKGRYVTTVTRTVYDTQSIMNHKLVVKKGEARAPISSAIERVFAVNVLALGLVFITRLPFNLVFGRWWYWAACGLAVISGLARESYSFSRVKHLKEEQVRHDRGSAFTRANKYEIVSDEMWEAFAQKLSGPFLIVDAPVGGAKEPDVEPQPLDTETRCPHCGTVYHDAEYDPDEPVWRCSGCNGKLEKAALPPN